jgi:KEOPS complex subunit Cgi121
MSINVFGAKGDALDPSSLLKAVARLERAHGITIQLLRADRVFGIEHLQSAAEKALRAFGNGTNMSKTLGMEIMLYAAAERQTSEALRKMGVFDGIAELGLVVVGGANPEEIIRELGLERDDSALGPEGKDPAVFGIPTCEADALGPARVQELVLEKVAVSEVLR